jgi:DNA polymerase I-like protein with 3'-5' exonuclease and polymerase domains
MMQYSTPAAIRFLLEGSLALSQIEHNGVRVDKGYLDQTYADLTAQTRTLYKELEADKEVYKPWVRRFGSATNLMSRDQLADVLFRDLGIKPLGLTRTGKMSTDKSVLDKIDLPFVAKFRRVEQLKDVLSTYLEGIRRELVERDGMWFIHPSYGLNVAATFRSVCKNPNWQNIPSRDWWLAQLVRRCYIPLPGDHFVENDFGQIEVRIAACYTHDPVLIKYVSDPTTDMHRDMACEIFFLTPEQVGKMKKTARHGAKNMFVFPEFYGSTYFNCAPQIWDEMTRKTKEAPAGWTLPDGTPLVKHLRRKGIKELGDCDRDTVKEGTRPGTFVHHLKEIERNFWDKRFKVYRDWKRSWFDQYQREGGLSMLTGFRVNARLTRTEVCNFPIQGSAFHCELWSLIEILKRVKKYKMAAKVVGQIHDCDVASVSPKHLDAYLDMVHEVKTTALPKAWKWICVPMEVEAEVTDVDKPWAEKKVWVRNGEACTWAAKA